MDIHTRSIYPGIITFSQGVIESIERADVAEDVFIVPGLIDAHIHIESSMVTPGAFSLAAVKHGTTGVVSDPHEIANVLGVDGVKFMIEDGKKVPLKFWFGAPSCVPATSFETSGSVLNHADVEALLENPDIYYLSEMMNYPGVIFKDNEVMKKLSAAGKAGKPVDGHAPGLKGDDLRKYVHAGITTDHECSTIEEAREKCALGMKILIREGSAARNLDSLKELIAERPEMVMLCSDDLHPEMLKKRHMNKIVARLIKEGYDKYDVLRSATINPAQHYNLNAGLLRQGDPADFILCESLETMNVTETWIDGVRVFNEGKPSFEYVPGPGVNRFNCSVLNQDQIKISGKPGKYRVIEAFEGELLTKEILLEWKSYEEIKSNPSEDILKIVVKDRYNDSPPAVGFIIGFGLERGAFASSVAHDSHNIIAVGTNDEDIVSAINKVISMQGGLAVSEAGKINSLQLNIAGIMTTRSCAEVASDYEELNERVIRRGSKMRAPFMTLSFMALLVIPEIKLSDKGLFDSRKFGLVPLFTE